MTHCTHGSCSGAIKQASEDGAIYVHRGSGWYVLEKVTLPHTLPTVGPRVLEKAGSECTPGRVKARRPAPALGACMVCRKKRKEHCPPLLSIFLIYSHFPFVYFGELRKIELTKVFPCIFLFLPYCLIFWFCCTLKKKGKERLLM